MTFRRGLRFLPYLVVAAILLSALVTARANNPAPAPHPRFVNITRSAGINFVHNNGAFGAKYLPETLGSGVCFIDYNNTGRQSILLVNGEDWPGHPLHRYPTTMELWRNNGNGTFTNVTRQAHLNVPMYGMGCAIGDYNNDGCDDIFVTAVGQNHLFRNNCNGTFTDVTKQAGLWGPKDFSTSAAWIQATRDGLLDLVVANYVKWSPKTDIYCTINGKTKSYCTAQVYHGESLTFWRNNGNGTFTNVTKQAGLYDPNDKSLGIAVADFNNDGWPDIAVSNDDEPNKLYINNHNGTFTSEGVTAGIAYSGSGVARSGMGIAAADYNHSGYPSLVITNFSNQMLSLYQNQGNGLFINLAPHSEIGRASLLTLGFGCFWFDYNLDGWPDLFVANGHIDPGISAIQPQVHYAEPPLLFENLGNGKFANLTKQMGASFNKPRVARGTAFADVNNDGAPDLVITTNNGPAALFLNEGETNNSLEIKLVGVESNRDGLDSTVRVRAGGMTQSEMLTNGGSYLSSSELILTFGLGRYKKASLVEIDWPSGHRDFLRNVAANQLITVKEGVGIIARKPLNRRGTW
jgi:hypothetical protein